MIMFGKKLEVALGDIKRLTALTRKQDKDLTAVRDAAATATGTSAALRVKLSDSIGDALARDSRIVKLENELAALKSLQADRGAAAFKLFKLLDELGMHPGGRDAVHAVSFWLRSLKEQLASATAEVEGRREADEQNRIAYNVSEAGLKETKASAGRLSAEITKLREEVEQHLHLESNSAAYIEKLQVQLAEALDKLAACQARLERSQEECARRGRDRAGHDPWDSTQDRLDSIEAWVARHDEGEETPDEAHDEIAGTLREGTGVEG